MPSPTLPAPRIAYDRDGSFCFVSRNVGTSLVPFSVQPNALQRLNADEFGGLLIDSSWWNIAGDLTGKSPHFISVVFPTLQNLVAWYASARGLFWSTPLGLYQEMNVGLDIEFQVSKDTTNGLDGTWTTMANKASLADHLLFGSEMAPLLPDDTTASSPPMYEAITSGDPQYKNALLEPTGWQYLYGPAQHNVRGVRLYFPRHPDTAMPNFSYVLAHFHLYGAPDADATPDRLEIVDATTGDPKGDFHWGDIDYKNTDTDTFKIKNLASTLTANSVTAAIKENYPTGSGSSLQLSTDGGSTWHSSVSLGNIAAGASSGTITVRLDPASGLIGQRFARVEAEVGSWT